jgi:hypothetical protein
VIGDFIRLVAWLWPEGWSASRRGLARCIIMTMLCDIMFIYLCWVVLGHLH